MNHLVLSWENTRSENTIFGLKFFFEPVLISGDSSKQEIITKFQFTILQFFLPRNHSLLQGTLQWLWQVGCLQV